MLKERPYPGYSLYLFYVNDTASTEVYTLSLHDALPICRDPPPVRSPCAGRNLPAPAPQDPRGRGQAHRSAGEGTPRHESDRKSTRLNSIHANISYAVVCLYKKKSIERIHITARQWAIES